MADSSEIPQYKDLIWPTVEVLRELGGSARIDEISEGVIERLGLNEDQQAIRRRPGDSMSLIDYRLAWARSYLKSIGAADNSERGVWALTEAGRTLRESEIEGLVRKWKRDYSQRKRAEALEVGSEDEVEADVVRDWRGEVIGRLLELAPGASSVWLSDCFGKLGSEMLRS
jgi:restriction system protein